VTLYRDRTPSASFKWGHISNVPTGEIINKSTQPISYLLSDPVARSYLVKDLDAGEREVFYHPTSFGKNAAFFAIIPHSE
jgi:hypothetical protein